MSLTDTLTALSTGVSNAYDAIEAKSGTIPANKNVVNLADSIATISGGGGGSFGTVKVQGGTIYTIQDLGEYLSLGVPISEGGMGGESTITPTIDGTTLQASAITEVELGSAATATPCGFLAGCSNLSKLTLANETTELGDYFLVNLMNLPNINSGSNSVLNFPGVKKVGKYFMACTDYMNQYSGYGVEFNFPELQEVGMYVFANEPNCANATINMPKLVTMKSYCFVNGTMPGATVTLPATLATLEYNAFVCQSYTLIVDAPVSALPSDTSRRNSMLNCYSQQWTITMKGSTRADWMTALPNSSSQPYRNLVDGGAS